MHAMLPYLDSHNTEMPGDGLQDKLKLSFRNDLGKSILLSRTFRQHLIG